MAQCHCKGELHLHAAGKILEFLFVRQGKLLKILLILFLIPVLIDSLHDSAQMGNKESLGKGKLIENNADVLPVFCAASCMPKDENTSTVRRGHSQNQLHGGGFARTIFSDETHNCPLRQGKRNVRKRKLRITFAKMINYKNHIFHTSDPFSSIYSSYKRESISLSSSRSIEAAFA